MMMKCMLAAAMLLLAVPAQATYGNNGKTTYEGRARANNTFVMGTQLIVEEGLRSFANVTQQFLEGRFQLGPPVPKSIAKKEVKLACLNSVAPAPLNWKMFCPGKDARILSWTDSAGAFHQEFLLRPQANLTALQAIWFVTTYTMGLLPPIVEYRGKSYYFYHLWHPLDHVEAAIKMAPSTAPGNILGSSIYTLINERYRNLPGDKSGRNYETNGWFVSYDPIINLMKNRVIVGINLMGIQAWTLKVEWIDTKEGVVTHVELVVGAPPKGWDPLHPTYGNLFAGFWNDALVGPMLGRVRNSPDWEGAFDAISRHIVEEFGNLGFFVPELYAKYAPLGKVGVNTLPSLGNFLHALNKTRADVPTLNFYNQLAAIVNRKPAVAVNGTKPGAAAVALVKAVDRAIATNPQSAGNSTGTPKGSAKAPLFKAEAAAVDSIKAAIRG